MNKPLGEALGIKTPEARTQRVKAENQMKVTLAVQHVSGFVESVSKRGNTNRQG